MKTLEQLLTEIELAPTVMDLSLEQEFCRELVKHQYQSIGAQWNTVREILDRLQESHTDTFYEMRSGEEFRDFVNWSQQLANETTDPALAEYLAGVASMFSMTPGHDGNGTPDQSIRQNGAEGRVIP